MEYFLSQKLDLQPGPKTNSASQISTTNAGTGQDISYEELITIANSVFGERHWSHSITRQTVDFVEYVMGNYHIGCAAFVRVERADGIFHEDMGYSVTECSTKGSAIKSARSLSITAALKRSLLCFGGIIEEKIKEKARTTKRFKRDSIDKSRADNGVENLVKKPLVPQENPLKDITTSENVVPSVEENLVVKKLPGKIETPSTPTRNKSPNPAETEGEASVINDAELVVVESDNAVNDPGNLGNNNGAGRPGASGRLSEDELRAERKRRQKQKQEEFKRLMKEKFAKVDETPNTKF